MPRRNKQKNKEEKQIRFSRKKNFYEAKKIAIFNQNLKSFITYGQRKKEFFYNTTKNTLDDGTVVKILAKKYKKCDILEIFGHIEDTSTINKIVISENNLPLSFPKNVDAEAQEIKKKKYKQEQRLDLTKYKIVTIDGEDAKDFDDAVYVEFDNKQKIFNVIVAIADVSFYVGENSPIDIEAQKRGNSIYMPSYVIPMLPEILSNDLCSLREGEEKRVLSMIAKINLEGDVLEYDFYKAKINSYGRLTYNEVEEALNGKFNTKTSKLKTEIDNLYKIWKVLNIKREKRNALNIVKNELVFNIQNHELKGIGARQNLRSHKIIEELMVLTNVLASNFIKKNKLDNTNIFPYRNHDLPKEEELEKLLDFIRNIGYKIRSDGIFEGEFFVKLQKDFANTEYAEIINNYILYCQQKAVYATKNKGHFGLGLSSYSHFTSPIRRYSDLLSHRVISSIITKNKFDTEKDISNILHHINDCEINATKVEREAEEKFSALWYHKHLNQSILAKVVTINKYGIFADIGEFYNVSGLLPARILKKRGFCFNEMKETYQNGKRKIQKGDKLNLTIMESNPLNGMIAFDLP